MDIFGILTLIGGLALFLYGMSVMGSGLEKVSGGKLELLLERLTSNSIFAVLLGAGVTAVIQSSSATTVMVVGFVNSGIMKLSQAIGIIMGANIGTCVTAMLSAIGANKSAKRTAFVHLYFNLIGAVAFMALYFGLDLFIDFSFSDDTINAAGIALIHSIFNIGTTLLLLPFIRGLEKLAYLTIPLSSEETKPAVDTEFLVLDDRFLQTPGFAIEQCRSLASKMAELSEECFLEAVDVLLGNYSEESAQEVIALENRIDVYEDKIGVYLTKLNSQNLAYHDSQNVSTLLHCITDIERISDHAVNILESAKEMNKRKLHFSKKAVEEIYIYTEAVRDILRRAFRAFIDGDEQQALTVEPLEEVIDELNKNIKKRHVKRLRKGKCTIDLGLILSDIATNYERVADHCSNIALYLIQGQDTELEAHSYVTHLREKDDTSFELQVESFTEKYGLGKNK